MATNTYVALRTTTVGTAVSSVTIDLTGITGYTDLRIVINGGSSSSAANILMRYNNDSTSGLYSMTDLTGDGSSATSHRVANANQILCNYFGYMDTGYTTNVLVDIFQFANSNVNKTNLTRANNASNGLAATVGLWRNTAPITSVTFLTGAGNFLTNTTFTVYGIAAQTQTAKATGGTIYYGGDGYVYHKFTSTASFTPTSALSADILVVAGGGASGNSFGGGGGAGGVIYFTNQALASGTAYTCTVGAGGAGNGAQVPGAVGSNSTFASLTAAIGGGGGACSYGPATSGGSGGGGSQSGSPTNSAGGASTQTGVGATAYYGNAGGTNTTSTSADCGGGGAGAPGTTPSGSVGGAGGIGTTAFDTWGAITSSGELVSGIRYYAGGGAGNGLGGTGVRGYGGGGAAATAGLANTGGGGGGDNGAGMAGGSGIIIVRYPG